MYDYKNIGVNNKNKLLKHLNMIFEIFRKYEIKINIEKCSFFQEEVEVLGHIVTNKGLQAMDSKVNTVKNWIRPCNINELQSFLGTALLNKLLRMNVSFI